MLWSAYTEEDKKYLDWSDDEVLDPSDDEELLAKRRCVRTALPQSKHAGVTWNAPRNKWVGRVADRSLRQTNGFVKSVYVGAFDDEQACADAVAKKRIELEKEIAQKLHDLAQELEHTRGLPLMPADLADAEPGTVYYGEMTCRERGAETKVFGPTRYVRGADKNAPGGFIYQRSCHANLVSGEPCPHHVCRASNSVFCKSHGGAPKAGEGSDANYCSVCRTTQLRLRGSSQGRGGSQRRHHAHQEGRELGDRLVQAPAAADHVRRRHALPTRPARRAQGRRARHLGQRHASARVRHDHQPLPRQPVDTARRARAGHPRVVKRVGRALAH